VEHLTFDQLARFREGALDGAELLAADDHLAVCGDCRARLQPGSRAAKNWAELGRGLRASALAAEPHIEFESMRAFVDGDASQADRMRLETHLLECPDCRAEVDDLKSFAARLEAPPQSPARFNRYLIFGPIAAMLLAGLFLMRPHQAPAPALAIALRDGGKIVGLDRQGRLVGAVAGDDAIVEALRQGKISVNFPEGLRTSRSVLLGGPSGETRFHVLSPVGEPVLQETPEFRWDPAEHARAYKVQVFDPDYQLVASSPEITATSWIPERPLARGKRYVWQVTAIGNGPAVTAPQPPDAEARFEVVAAADAGAIEQARQPAAGHLELAIRYAHAGLCREALSEIDGLGHENNGSALVQQMRAGLAGQCDSPGQR
jgi:hypothetical protein